MMGLNYLLLVVVVPAVLTRRLERSDIVGGHEVQPHSLPYQVSLQLTEYDDWHYCGGALLTSSLVVTAAHCCYQLDMSTVRLVAGDHDLYVQEGTEQSAGVGSVVVHESYDPYSQENDICLVQLDRSLDLGEEVGVIRRAGPGDKDKFTDGTGRVSGWGDLYEGGVMPDKLMAVEVPLVTDTECRHDYGELAVTASMLCAGDTGKDACQGDSGGPLVCSSHNDGNFDLLCGLVSWGLGCGRENYPGVYTELAYFSDWIDQTVRQLQANNN